MNLVFIQFKNSLKSYLEKRGQIFEIDIFFRFVPILYEAGAISRPEKMQAKFIQDNVVAKERKKGFEISRIDRFRYRTRYFKDSGIIGSKEFVAANYQRFKHLFYSKHEKKPKPVKGLDGMYSLKRLSEI